MNRPRLYFVSGMFCGSCARAVEAKAATVPGVLRASLNFSSRLLRVELEPHADADLVGAQIESGVRQSGFELQHQKADWLAGFLDQLKSEQANAVPPWRLFLVFFFAMWSSTAAFAGYLGGVSPPEAWLLATLSTALGLPALALGAWPFAKAGLRSLFHAKTLTLDLFVALGAASAALISLQQVSLGSNGSYVDSAAMILTLLLGAKIAEGRLAQQMAASILDNIQGRDVSVTRVAPGPPVAKNASHIRRGDRVRFQAGQTVVFDGALVDPEGTIDSHLLNGESNPLRVRNGDPILAGSVARSDLTLQVEKPLGTRAVDSWAETALASASRPHRYSGLLGRIEASLVAVALASSTLLAGLEYLRSSSPGASLQAFFVGVLIFCPCLFAAILPYGKQLAQLHLRKLGFLCHRVECLWDLTAVRTVVFDKTGTLQTLETGLLCSDSHLAPELLRLLESLRHEAPHPVLDGLPNAADGAVVAVSLPKPEVTVTPGQGAVAKWSSSGQQLVIGRASFVVAHLDHPAPYQEGQTLVAYNGQLVAELVTGASAEGSALALLKRLRQEMPQLRLLILSGDPKPVSGPLKNLLDSGELEYRGNLSPEEKAELVPAHSLFVGDGLNDILAQAKAQVSLRVGHRAKGYSAVDLEVSQANLIELLNLLSFSARFSTVLRQTATLAIVYNLLAWFLAALGWFSPLGAVCAMLLSLTLMGLSATRLVRS